MQRTQPINLVSYRIRKASRRIKKNNFLKILCDFILSYRVIEEREHTRNSPGCLGTWYTPPIIFEPEKIDVLSNKKKIFKKYQKGFREVRFTFTCRPLHGMAKLCIYEAFLCFNFCFNFCLNFHLVTYTFDPRPQYHICT